MPTFTNIRKCESYLQMYALYCYVILWPRLFYNFIFIIIILENSEYIFEFFTAHSVFVTLLIVLTVSNNYFRPFAAAPIEKKYARIYFLKLDNFQIFKKIILSIGCVHNRI